MNSTERVTDKYLSRMEAEREKRRICLEKTAKKMEDIL